MDAIQGRRACYGRDASRAGRYALFADDLERADLARVVQVRAAAEFLAEIADRDHPNHIGILLAEEHHGARLAGLGQRHVGATYRRTSEDPEVDFPLDLLEFLGLHSFGVREVEPQQVVVHFRALLLGMFAELGLQRMVQEVGGRMGAADPLPPAGIDLGRYGRTERDFALAKMAAMQREPAVDLRVDHLEAKRFTREFAEVADLPAHLAVEGGLVQHDDDRMFVVHLVGLVAKLSGGNDADHLGIVDLERFVANELAAVHGLFQCFERVGLEKFNLSPAARFQPMALHLGRVAVPIEGQVMLGGQGLEQLGREAVGLVHVGRFGAGDHAAILGLHLLKGPLDAIQPGVDGREKVALLLFDHSGDTRDRFAQLGISRLHQLGHGANQLVQERIADAHLPAVQHGPTQQPFDDVLLLVRPGIDVLMHGERAGADMVGNTTQAAARFALGIVLHVANFTGRLDQRAQDVDVVVRLDALQHGRCAFEPHARVDVLARQRSQVVRRIAHAVELREHEVPNLDLTGVRMVVNLAARSANAVGAKAGRVGGPKVLVFAEPFELLRRELDVIEPDPGRLFVVEVDRGREPRGIDAEPLLVGAELPGPVDRLAFEIVAEAEIAEHLEERMVVGGPADVVDIARPQTLLAGGRPGELQLAPA